MGGPRELVKVDEISIETMREPYRIESLSRTEREIRELKDKLATTAKVGLLIAYELGRRLVAVKQSLDHGQFLPWLEQNFQMSDRTAQKYMRIYSFFKDTPQKILEELHLQEAYTMAGVVRATRKPRQSPEIKIAYKPRDPEAERARMVALFEQPTLSGKPLKNHRVEHHEGTIWVFRKDKGVTLRAMDIYLPRPFGMNDFEWNEAMESFVIAMELYLHKIEQWEEVGKVAPPEDDRILTVLDRLESERRNRRLRIEEAG